MGNLSLSEATTKDSSLSKDTVREMNNNSCQVSLEAYADDLVKDIMESIWLKCRPHKTPGASVISVDAYAEHLTCVILKHACD